MKVVIQVGTKRPYRLYHAQTKKFMPWRCYKVFRNAHIGALCDVRWGKVGDVIEVIDITNGKHHGSYKRELRTVSFARGGE